MEAVCSSETQVYFYQATRRTITDDNTLYNYLSENLASLIKHYAMKAYGGVDI
jgi:hypothetical protein